MELVVYKASAGSGKTFTLAVEYIRLLIAEPRAYQYILAVTFTNKATAEMKERILSQLYGIYKGFEDSEPYLNCLKERTNESTEVIQKKAGIALNNILHDYNRFRIETIDSFFQSVMRNLARELELGLSLNTELNNKDILGKAVDTMIEKLYPNSKVLSNILNYINECIADNRHWNVSNAIKSFGENIFNEEYVEKGELLREKLKKDESLIYNYQKQLREIQEAALEQMKAFCEQFEGVLEMNGLGIEDLKSGTRGISGYFLKLKRGELSDKIKNKTVTDCLESADNWVKKTSKQHDLIISLVSKELLPLLTTSEEFRTKNNNIVNSCVLASKHLYKLSLLTSIDEEVRAQNRLHNRFLLSDTNQLLHSLIHKGDSSFVFEKIGTNLRHIMIDEFQDTSRMQWGNFRLLLLEGLSQGANSLVVGDVKQSIYRWRNGDWKILNGLQGSIEHFPIRTETLKTNRRSETEIISFNNTIFTHAKEVLNQRYKEMYDIDCKMILDAYNDVQQDFPEKEKRGYVKVNLLAPDKGEDYEELMLQRLGNQIQELLASGIKSTDIAILVRKNKAIPLIADYLRKYYQIQIVSDEAFCLDASISISIIVDALRYLNDEANYIARTALGINFQKFVLKKECAADDLIRADKEELLPSSFLEDYTSLRAIPLYELVEKLMVYFKLDLIESQEAYLFVFLDAITEYLQNNPSDLTNFLQYWDETLHKKTIPGGEIEGIRILSIHKSKGLEFHTVLIPFCDWKIENESNNQLVWCMPEDKPFNELDLVPVNYSTAMSESAFKNDFQKEQLHLWIDNLNLLYVAFTRAGKNLFIWGKHSQKGTISELLEDCFNKILPYNNEEKEETKEDSKEEELIYEQGSLFIEKNSKAKDTQNCLLQKPQIYPIALQSPNYQVEFKQSNQSADFIRSLETDVEDKHSSKHFIDRGCLLHTLFSAIKSKQDIEPAIQTMIADGVIGNQLEEKEIRDITNKAFANEKVQEWYDGSWNICNECNILYKEGDEIKTKRPDRVMVKKDEVIVVDFKFGQPHAKYKKQVLNYMELLVQMGYNNPKGYLWYVLNDTIEKIY